MTLSGKRICVVTAHPDDEAMFFSPTLAAVVPSNDVFLLCLSSGDFDGLGETRKKEILKSARVFGIEEDRVRVVEHPELQDGMSNKWPAAIAGKVIKSFVSENNIDTLFTFDSYGVSGHPNHIDTANAVASAIRNKVFDGVVAYSLRSTSLCHKYSGLAGYAHISWSNTTRAEEDDSGSLVFCTSSPHLSYQSMSAHHSQFVWYRFLFVFFSLYSYVNILDRLQQ